MTLRELEVKLDFCYLIPSLRYWLLSKEGEKPLMLHHHGILQACLSKLDFHKIALMKANYMSINTAK